MINSEFIQKRYKFVKVIKGRHMVCTPEEAFDGIYVLKEKLQADGTLKNVDRARPYLANPLDMYFCNLGWDCPSNEGDDCPSGLCKPFDTYWQGYDLGFLCGSVNGIVVVDIDPRNIAGNPSLPEIYKKITTGYGPLPATWTAITGRGGVHLYYRYPYEFISNKGRLISGVDILGENSWCRIPPYGTKHGTYKWKHMPGGKVGLADLPGWVITVQASRTARTAPSKKRIPMSTKRFSDKPLSNDVEMALSHIPISAAYDHETFCKLGYALCGSGHSRLFVQWSQTDPDRSKWVTQNQIRHFENSNSVNIASLFEVAKRYGWGKK